MVNKARYAVQGQSMPTRRSRSIQLAPGSVLLILVSLSVAACQPPPPAPEGLEEASRYMIREFYKDDAVVGAGLTGLLNWYDESGYELVNQGATAEDGGEAFQLEDITAADITSMPSFDDGRDLSKANGIVAISDMDCSWQEAESYLVRSDQDVVFEEFNAYQRSFLSSRELFEAATESLSFPNIATELAGLATGEVAITDEQSGGIMLTSNEVSSTDLGVTLDYSLVLHFRHGLYQVQDQQLPVMMILSWLPSPVDSSSGSPTRFEQSYSIEVNYGLGDRTLRIFAVWTYVDSSFLGEDSSLWSIGAVNKSRDAAQRLSDICAGEIAVPAE
ncbi:MAG: hypothetical protein CMP23_09155 [Rickettsiales bacterium]|nr:hypothetical protein [Rickettsiales bacterium]